MARVLVPTYAKTYNHNPRGSATATVSLAGRNPFEGGVPVRMKAPTSFLPMGAYPDNMPFGGMGGLGDGEATPTAASPAAASWWQTGLTTVLGAGAQIGTQLVGARINQLYPPSNPPVPTTGMQNINGTPVATLPIGQQYYPPAAPASKMPMILIGVGVVGLIAAFMMTRKR